MTSSTTHSPGIRRALIMVGQTRVTSSAAWATGELACRPGSVHPLSRAGGHPSRAAVAGRLVRSTRELGRAALNRPRRHCVALRRLALLTLLRVGFTKPPQSPAALVVSYTTVSPLPPAWHARSGGGLFSVALSRGSPRVGVTDHPALRSPDLPRRSRRTGTDATARPACPSLSEIVSPAARSPLNRSAQALSSSAQLNRSAQSLSASAAWPSGEPCRSRSARRPTRCRSSRCGTAKPHQDSS
jgi:hypothetical protein